SGGNPLTPGWGNRTTWDARGEQTGPLVVKARRGERAREKTQWSADHLPLLGARGYPVPAIIWHGMIGLPRGQWHVTVQNRLPGRPLTTLDGRTLEEMLRLIGRQADAGLPAGDRDFTGYIANVLFDDWDDVWADALRVDSALCSRIRRWLRPVWGLELPPADFAHNDLNLSNILTDGETITGVVDWDEFALGSRALDLIVLAFDCERDGTRPAADRLLSEAAAVAGDGELRCLVSYRALATLAEDAREGQPPHDDIRVVSALLDRL
ncbi:MAG TPA: aminoglycoside phosphotransferase family protein, partial [Trebonia sp.]|nr:aminoglycoside phosphotransferase family protein [Trebonia sp.]